MRNIAAFYADERFHFVAANVADVPDLNIDQIYNLASPTAPGAYQRMPRETLEANIAGTEALLKLATSRNARMLQASTIRVTEELERSMLPCTTNCYLDDRYGADSPHACYVEGKREAEKLCREYHEKHNVDVKIARLYNTYGPRMARDDSRVVPTFVTRALRGEPLLIAGDGKQRDSFCYIDDMLDGLVAYMNSDIKYGPMEFGYPVPISILDLARLVRRVTGSTSAIKFNGVARSARELEAKRRRPVPDIREAQRRLGWLPKTELEQGLAATAEYYQEL
jgi:UDP-glucuronate decarboxylase